MVDSAGRLAFAPFGGTVEVLDITNPYSPVKLSSIHTRGTVLSTHSAGDHLYIATGRFGFEVWDLQDPTNPTKVAVWNSPCGVAKDITLHRGFLILLSTCGLMVFDSSYRNVFTYHTPIQTVHFFGDTAVAITDLTSSDTLIFMDFSDPASPNVIGRLTVSDAVSSATYGHYLYVSFHYGALKVYDVGTQSHIYGILMGDFSSIDVGDGFMVGVRDFNSDLAFINLSDPTHPSLDSTVSLDTLPSALSFAVDLLGDTVVVFGILDNTRRFAVLKGSHRLSAYSPAIPMSSIALGNGYLYYIGYPDSLCILTVGDPHNIRRVRCVPGFRTGSPGNLLVSDTLLFLSGDSLKIYSLSDPVNPTLLSTLPVPTVWMEKRDTLLFTSNSTTFNIVSVADPSSPYLLSSVSDSGPVAISGDIAVVGSNIYDVSDPTSPTLLSTLGLPGVKDVYTYDTLLVVGLSSDMLKIFSISNPYAPVHITDLVGTYVSGAYHYAFALGYPGGYVRAYDLRTMDLVGYYSYQTDLNPYPFLELVATDPIEYYDSHVYALFRRSGIHAFRFRLPLGAAETLRDVPEKCSSYYDVSGRRVEPKGSGIYFCRKGRKVVKILRR